MRKQLELERTYWFTQRYELNKLVCTMESTAGMLKTTQRANEKVLGYLNAAMEVMREKIKEIDQDLEEMKCEE